MLDDEALLQQVLWPVHPDAARVRAILHTIRRYIDFDGTLIVTGGQLRPSFDGVPTDEFLAQEPYVIQTWNPTDAIRWLPALRQQPKLVVVPPLVQRDGTACKDFAALGVTGAVIYDDDPHHIHAPGCEVRAPW